MIPKNVGVFARKYSRTFLKMEPDVFFKNFPKYLSIYSMGSVVLKVVSDCLVNKAIMEKLISVIPLNWMTIYHLKRCAVGYNLVQRIVKFLVQGPVT